MNIIRNISSGEIKKQQQYKNGQNYVDELIHLESSHMERYISMGKYNFNLNQHWYLFPNKFDYCAAPTTR